MDLEVTRTHVRDLLNGKLLREQLQRVIAETRALADQDEAAFRQLPPEHRPNSVPGRLEGQLHRKGKLGRVFQKFVFDKLFLPLPFRPEEVFDEFDPLLWDMVNDRLPPMSAVADSLAALVIQQHVDEIELCQVGERTASSLEADDIVVSFESDADNWVALLGQRMWANATVELVFSSIKRTHDSSDLDWPNSVLTLRANFAGTNGSVTASRKRLNSIVSTLVGMIYADSFDCRGGLLAEQFEEQKGSLLTGLRVMLNPIPGDKGLEFRVRNGIEMLILAREHPNDALRAALSYVAIDAMLGENKPGESGKNLIAAVARLLEPDPQLRSAAEDAIDRLYKLRNAVLHRGDLDIDDKVGDQMSLLAGSLLVVALDGLHWQTEFPEKFDQFLRRVLQERYSSGCLPGTRETAARSLWNSNQTAA